MPWRGAENRAKSRSQATFLDTTIPRKLRINPSSSATDHHHPEPSPSPTMEASASASASAPAALLPLLAAPPRFLHLPLRRPSTRRHGCGSGLLLQPPPPPGPGSRAHFKTTCCASSPDQADVLQGGTSLVSVAAFTLLAALQLVWLRWRRATHGDSPEVSLNSEHFVDCCFLRSPRVNDTSSR